MPSLGFEPPPRTASQVSLLLTFKAEWAGELVNSYWSHSMHTMRIWMRSPSDLICDPQFKRKLKENGNLEASVGANQYEFSVLVGMRKRMKGYKETKRRKCDGGEKTANLISVKFDRRHMCGSLLLCQPVGNRNGCTGSGWWQEQAHD